MESVIGFYKEKVQFYQDALKRLQPVATLVAVLRLACFFVFAYAAYRWISGHTPAWAISTLLLVAAFSILVRVAWRLNDRKALLEKLLFINKNELDVLQHQPSKFNNGESFLSNDGYAGDLDIFGPGSLFHLLNRTTTQHGTHQLAHLLQQPSLSKTVIEQQQQAIQALATQKELRQLLTAHGLINEEKEGTLHDIANWLQRPAVLINKGWVKILRWLVVVYSSVFLIYWLATNNYYPLIPVIMLCWLVNGMFGKRIHEQHTLLGKKQSILEQYAAILLLFSKVHSGASDLLKTEKVFTFIGHVRSALEPDSEYFSEQLFHVRYPLFMGA
jgi:hypothetical protein